MIETLEKFESLHTLLKLLDKSEVKLVYITDNGKLFGTVTDGDVRRSIINSGHLDLKIDEICNTEPMFFNHLGVLQNDKSNYLYVQEIPQVNEFGEIVSMTELDDYSLPAAVPALDQSELKNIFTASDSSWISSIGPFINSFEYRFAETHRKKYGVAVNNGTSALMLALQALKIGYGDEVIIPNLTFAAVANAVIAVGADCVLSDVEQDRPLLDLDEVLKLVSKKTKVVIVVHSYGYIVDVARLRKILPDSIYIIEDCAEAHFGQLGNTLVGEVSEIATFSFFANKIITTGEGGMCLTSSQILKERMETIRDHGMSKDRRYWHKEWGFNFRMTNIQAAIGIAQLDKVTDILENRERSCNSWKEFLKNYNFIEEIPEMQTEKKALWFYNVKCNAKREQFINLLTRNKIDTRPFFYPLNAMPPYKNFRAGPLCNSKQWRKIGLSLPVYGDKKNTNLLKKRLLRITEVI
jgi:perosamine synthetase